jgi:hypothetical protein
MERSASAFSAVLCVPLFFSQKTRKNLKNALATKNTKNTKNARAQHPFFFVPFVFFVAILPIFCGKPSRQMNSDLTRRDCSGTHAVKPYLRHLRLTAFPIHSVQPFGWQKLDRP